MELDLFYLLSIICTATYICEFLIEGRFMQFKRDLKWA